MYLATAEAPPTARASAAVALAVLRHVPRLRPQMDAEVAALGRATSARNLANDADPAAHQE